MHFLTASVILPQSRGYEVKIEGKVELSHQYSFLIKIHFTNSNSHELSGVSCILAHVWLFQCLLWVGCLVFIKQHVAWCARLAKHHERAGQDGTGCWKFLAVWLVASWSFVALYLCCSEVIEGGTEKQVFSKAHQYWRENRFSIQARAAVMEQRRPWVCCPFAEAGEIGEQSSAICCLPACCQYLLLQLLQGFQSACEREML